MEKALAQLLTTALVQFVDREQPKDKMCVSSIEAEELERCFTEEKFNRVEDWYAYRMKPELTEFEKCMLDFAKARDEYEFDSTKVVELNDKVIELTKSYAKTLLALAKKELLSYADESNPRIEAMADLERTYFCNPEKLPKWLKDDIARKELNAHTKGYNKGYNDAEKRYNESAPYHFPIMPTPPSGWGCDGTHCTNPHHDCINCPLKYSSGGTITTPNTASGTSTATLHGNTSFTDGKEHNPSFTD